MMLVVHNDCYGQDQNLHKCVIMNSDTRWNVLSCLRSRSISIHAKLLNLYFTVVNTIIIRNKREQKQINFSW